VSDRRPAALDRPRLALRVLLVAALAVPAAALLAGCAPLGLPEPPPAGDGGTPCTRANAIAADTVVLMARACNPWCIHVPTGTEVGFINQDAATYLMLSSGPPPFEIPLPPSSGGSTPKLLAPGTVVVTDAHWPAATVTIYVE